MNTIKVKDKIFSNDIVYQLYFACYFVCNKSLLIGEIYCSIVFFFIEIVCLFFTSSYSLRKYSSAKMSNYP